MIDVDENLRSHISRLSCCLSAFGDASGQDHKLTVRVGAYTSVEAKVSSGMRGFAPALTERRRKRSVTKEYEI